MNRSSNPPYRQVRAAFADQTITVYQAYSSEIANAAIAAGKFVSPFKRDRVTWIKPSFLWMMYRSGWATKPGQERVLAVEITRSGFEWAIAHSALTHFDPDIHASYQEWKATQAQPVRIQWDPERDLQLQPMPWRAIQIGLGSEAVDHYADEWTVAVRDVTDLARAVHARVQAADTAGAESLLPDERPYSLAAGLARGIGATA